MTEGISALGTYGLGSAGLYGSYDPTMMGMMGSFGSGMMNPMLMGGYGMGMGALGMGSNYMDQYMELMKKYQEYAEKMEERKVEHSIEMHRKAQFAEVANLSAHDQAFFMKAVEDGDVQHGIREIHDAIRRGNMDYVTQKFFELKQEIYNKFSEYFRTSDGNINTDEKIKQYICILYSEIAGGYASSNGIKPDLKHDIEAYGETPLQHGFNKTFLNNKGHNQLNAEQALNQMFGTGINDEGSKAKAEKIGTYAARAAEIGTAGAAGSLAGMTALGLAKFFAPDFLINRIPDTVATSNATKWATKYKTWGKGAGIAAIALDILWQMTR